MLLINDDHYYIQIKDILYIESNNIVKIPRSIFDTMLHDDIVIENSQFENYIELRTLEEITFFNEVKSFIIDANLTTEEMRELLVKCQSDLERESKYFSKNYRYAFYDANAYYILRDKLQYKIAALNDALEKKDNKKIPKLKFQPHH